VVHAKTADVALLWRPLKALLQVAGLLLLLLLLLPKVLAECCD